MGKFTPGPLVVFDLQLAGSFVVGHPENNRTDGQGEGIALFDKREDAELFVAASDLVAICKVFLGHDERFQVSVGGNPIAVDKMLSDARTALSKALGEGE